jgi:hypothetical protein
MAGMNAEAAQAGASREFRRTLLPQKDAHLKE